MIFFNEIYLIELVSYKFILFSISNIFSRPKIADKWLMWHYKNFRWSNLFIRIYSQNLIEIVSHDWMRQRYDWFLFYISRHSLAHVLIQSSPEWWEKWQFVWKRWLTKRVFVFVAARVIVDYLSINDVIAFRVHFECDFVRHTDK